jgi:hypothetical protein
LSSHTLCLVAIKSTKYSMQNLSTSSKTILFAVLPFRKFYSIPHISFQSFYIPLNMVHPPCMHWTTSSSLLTKWIDRCIMTSKNDGGNSFFSNINVIATSFFSSPFLIGSTTLAQILLKT